MSPGLGYGRATLMTCISNKMHNAYTTQLRTNGTSIIVDIILSMYKVPKTLDEIL